MTRPICKLPPINRLKPYLLAFMLCVLVLASACGRRGNLYLPPESEPQAEPYLAAPAPSINTRH